MFCNFYTSSKIKFIHKAFWCYTTVLVLLQNRDTTLEPQDDGDECVALSPYDGYYFSQRRL